jgi:hypothetical protein
VNSLEDIHGLVLYSIAVAGSVAIEIVAFTREITRTRGALPIQYKRRAYYVAKIAFALLAAGPLAPFIGAKTVSMAFYIGLTAPLIYDRLAAGIPHPRGDDT